MDLDCKVFVFHKPLGSICSRVDPAVNNIIRRKGHPQLGERHGGEARPTVFDIVESAGFPNDYGLVGRLDANTSGIMICTTSGRLANAIKDPPAVAMPQSLLWFKTKEYKLCLLPVNRNESKYLSHDGEFEIAAFEADLSKPFQFRRDGLEIQVQQAQWRFLRRYQDIKYSKGFSHLGWCIEVLVTISEGKHHQIRRAATSCGFSVLSLTRTKVAGLSIDCCPNPGDCCWISDEGVQVLLTAMADYHSAVKPDETP